MNSTQIDILFRHGKFPHPFGARKLIETHISYVILGRSLAYKIKKDIQYSFLDFSTVARRKYFCEREVVLNNRLTKGVYLDVVPIREETGQLIVDGKRGKIIDYAVKMKRLQDKKQMHLLLKENRVTKKQIITLADLISNFHAHTEVIHSSFHEHTFASRFNDILSVADFIRIALGPEVQALIERAVRISDAFLRNHHDLLKLRAEAGYIRDCHGDLHSRNIFLYAQPIIFDCLEFNDAFRKMDVLDEIAFFCMDLEAEGCYTLSKAFTDEYFAKAKDTFGRQEQLLFTYYKCYRANVRAKVNALRAMKPEVSVKKGSLDDVKKYLDLMSSYLETLT